MTDANTPAKTHIAFLMIVDDVLGHSLLEVPLAEGNYAIKTFMFDGADEALGVGIRVRRPPTASAQRGCRHRSAAAVPLRSISRPDRKSARDARAVARHPPSSACDRLAA